MTDIMLNKPVALTMAQRVQLSIAKRSGAVAALPQQPQQQQAIPKALLLDLSGSMDGKTEKPGERRIDALRNLVSDMQLTSGQPVYAFSYSCERCDPNCIPEPSGGTDLAKAFKHLKVEGHKSVILITDGQPDDAAEALEEAKGLRLEIFYVGAGRKPAFLTQLAKACGGSAREVTMDKQLADTVRKLLA